LFIVDIEIGTNANIYIYDKTNTTPILTFPVVGNGYEAKEFDGSLGVFRSDNSTYYSVSIERTGGCGSANIYIALLNYF